MALLTELFGGRANIVQEMLVSCSASWTHCKRCGLPQCPSPRMSSYLGPHILSVPVLLDFREFLQPKGLVITHKSDAFRLAQLAYNPGGEWRLLKVQQAHGPFNGR
jgi:hypothetical protein